MAVRAVCLFLAITVVAAYQSDFTECPKELNAKHLVGNVTLDLKGQFLTKIIRIVRVPEIGMYDKVLNCLEVIDLSGTNSSGTVQLAEGGLQERFAEFKFISNFGGGLNYIIQAYTD